MISQTTLGSCCAALEPAPASPFRVTPYRSGDVEPTSDEPPIADELVQSHERGMWARNGLEHAQQKLQSITSSARNRIDCGMASPSALAALTLTTSSNLVGC